MVKSLPYRVPTYFLKKPESEPAKKYPESVKKRTGSATLATTNTNHFRLCSGYMMDGNRREGGPNNFGPQSPVDMKPDASLLSTSPTPPSLPTTSYHNYNPIASPQTPQVIFLSVWQIHCSTTTALKMAKTFDF